MLNQLVILDSVCTVVELIEEFKEFTVAVFFVGWIWQCVYHIWGDIFNPQILSLFLFFLDNFISLLNQLLWWLVNMTAHHSMWHHGAHPWLLEVLLLKLLLLLTRDLSVPHSIQICGLILKQWCLHLLGPHCVDLHLAELLCWMTRHQRYAYPWALSFASTCTASPSSA